MHEGRFLDATHRLGVARCSLAAEQAFVVESGADQPPTFFAKVGEFHGPAGLRALLLLYQGPVDLYYILADGYPKPLTKAQIAGRFHAGLFGTNQLCKQLDENEWRTIDELFPLLRYETPKRSLYQTTDVHGSEARNPALAILISILVISAVSLAGYFALRGGIQGSRNSTTAPTGFRVLVRAKATTNPPAPVAVSSAPVANTIVNATTLAHPPQSDIYLQQAGSTQVRLDEEKNAGEKRPSSLKTASTQSRKSAKNKRRPEGL